MSNTENMRKLITLLESVQENPKQILESIDEARELQRYIPKGSTKVADKNSSAVAYIYTNGNGKPAAIGYRGRANKRSFHIFFNTEKRREEYIQQFFKDIQASEAYRKQNDGRTSSEPRSVEVGDIICVNYGATMTLVDFYQVTSLVGNSSAMVQELATNDDGDGWSGHKTPIKDKFIGTPMKVRFSGKKCKIDRHYGKLWDGKPQYYNRMD